MDNELPVLVQYVVGALVCSVASFVASVLAGVAVMSAFALLDRATSLTYAPGMGALPFLFSAALGAAVTSAVVFVAVAWSAEAPLSLPAHEDRLVGLTTLVYAPLAWEAVTLALSPLEVGSPLAVQVFRRLFR